MNLTTRIAFRHLRSKYSFGFISFSTLLSIIGLILGIASLIIISCISDGFKNVINVKLAGIDGHIRLNSYLTEVMGTNKIQQIDSILQHLPISIKYISPYIEKHAIIRNGSLTEGIILYGVPETSLKNIFQLHQFTTGAFNFNYKHSIIIGRKLAQSLNVEVGDNLCEYTTPSLSEGDYTFGLTVTDIYGYDNHIDYTITVFEPNAEPVVMINDGSGELLHELPVDCVVDGVADIVEVVAVVVDIVVGVDVDYFYKPFLE